MTSYEGVHVILQYDALAGRTDEGSEDHRAHIEKLLQCRTLLIFTSTKMQQGLLDLYRKQSSVIDIAMLHWHAIKVKGVSRRGNGPVTYVYIRHTALYDNLPTVPDGPPATVIGELVLAAEQRAQGCFWQLGFMGSETKRLAMSASSKELVVGPLEVTCFFTGLTMKTGNTIITRGGRQGMLVGILVCPKAVEDVFSAVLVTRNDLEGAATYHVIEQIDVVSVDASITNDPEKEYAAALAFFKSIDKKIPSDVRQSDRLALKAAKASSLESKSPENVSGHTQAHGSGAAKSTLNPAEKQTQKALLLEQKKQEAEQKKQEKERDEKKRQQAKVKALQQQVRRYEAKLKQGPDTSPSPVSDNTPPPRTSKRKAEASLLSNTNMPSLTPKSKASKTPNTDKSFLRNTRDNDDAAGYSSDPPEPDWDNNQSSQAPRARDTSDMDTPPSTFNTVYSRGASNDWNSSQSQAPRARDTSNMNMSPFISNNTVYSRRAANDWDSRKSPGARDTSNTETPPSTSNNHVYSRGDDNELQICLKSVMADLQTLKEKKNQEEILVSMKEIKNQFKEQEQILLEAALKVKAAAEETLREADKKQEEAKRQADKKQKKAQREADKKQEEAKREADKKQEEAKRAADKKQEEAKRAADKMQEDANRKVEKMKMKAKQAKQDELDFRKFMASKIEEMNGKNTLKETMAELLQQQTADLKRHDFPLYNNSL